jgi:hypothetical protein
VLIGAMLLGGCATFQPQPMASIGKVSAQNIKSVLDVKFSQISLSNVRMTKALLTLSGELKKSDIAFQWSIEVGPPALNPPPPRDPFVNLSASNITLREVLDQICRQSGWTYKPVMEGHWFSFRAPPKH